jgi:hypothetical protein
LLRLELLEDRTLPSTVAGSASDSLPITDVPGPGSGTPAPVFVVPVTSDSSPGALAGTSPSLPPRFARLLQAIDKVLASGEVPRATVPGSLLSSLDTLFQHVNTWKNEEQRMRIDLAPAGEIVPVSVSGHTINISVRQFEITVLSHNSLEMALAAALHRLDQMLEKGGEPIFEGGHSLSTEMRRPEVITLFKESLVAALDTVEHHALDTVLHLAERGESWREAGSVNPHAERSPGLMEIPGYLSVSPFSWPANMRSPADATDLSGGTVDVAQTARLSEDVLLDAWADGIPAPQADLVPFADRDLSIVAAYLVGPPGSGDAVESVQDIGSELGLTDFIVGAQEPLRGKFISTLTPEAGPSDAPLSSAAEILGDDAGDAGGD